MEEVASGVFVESNYPPYNLVLVRTEDGGIVVDLPPSPVDTMNWLEQARATAGELRYVVLTDGARDRQMATAICDIPIIATKTTLRMMQAYDEERDRKAFMEDLAERYPEEVEAMETLRPRKPAFAFNERFTLYRETHTLEFETIQGSAPGSLWIHIPELNLLIAGETVVGNAVPRMAETPDSKAWLNTMTRLARLHSVESIVAGRGELLIGRSDIEPQREFIRVMRRAARTLARQSGGGLSLTQTAQELGQTFFNRDGQRAVKEIKAGLQTLVAEVEAQEDDEEDDES